MKDADNKSELTEFSVIKFFSLFVAKIKKINKYPLNSETLIVQQDAYKRLASDDSNGDTYEHFAILENARKEKDTDMRFAIEFSAEGFLMHIEGEDSMVFDFEECFKNEEQAAEQIISALSMLANGQLAILLTERYGRYCASEFLYYEDNSPTVLFMEGKYPWWWKKNDESNYDAVLLRNTYDIERQTPPRDFFLCFDIGNQLRRRGRILKNKELTPLTKQLHDATLTTIGFEMAGKKQEETVDDLFYKSWEFYVSGLIVLFFCAALWLWAPVPQFVKDHPVVFLLVTGPMTYLFSTILIFRKAYLKDVVPDHPLVRFDKKVHAIVKRFHPNKKTKERIDKLQRLQRVSKRLRLIFCLVAYLSFGVISASAVILYDSLTPDTLLNVNKEVVAIGVAVIGVLCGLQGYLTQTGRFHSIISRILSILLFIGMLFWLTGVIEEEHDDVTGMVFITNLFILLVQMLVSVVYDFIKRRYDEKMSYLVD